MLKKKEGRKNNGYSKGATKGRNCAESFRNRLYSSRRRLCAEGSFSLWTSKIGFSAEALGIEDLNLEELRKIIEQVLWEMKFKYSGIEIKEDYWGVIRIEVPLIHSLKQQDLEFYWDGLDVCVEDGSGIIARIEALSYACNDREDLRVEINHSTLLDDELIASIPQYLLDEIPG